MCQPLRTLLPNSPELHLRVCGTRQLLHLAAGQGSLKMSDRVVAPCNYSTRSLGIPTFLKHQRHLLTHCFGQCT
ncbi:hypothetical protein XAC2911_490001 [Xanthomonas citri pv. citri]|nr:hypothetical protein XAC2911_490001 [Xanthomonas citri pv. citri]